MNFKTIITLCALPLAVFAQDANTAPNEAAKNVAVTESEFSGNTSIDSADAGNIDAPASAIVDSKESEAAVAAADTENAADSTDSQEADDEKEMSQEEADAELAAAMGSDSTVSGSTTLTLDMSKAAIPTESRRIAGPYGLRTYRMHRGVDLGLCHGEDRTIVAAFPGKVKLVRNQGRRKGYGKYVIIDHGNGLTTLYAHLASWKVKVGDELQAGDTVGVGGNTGRSFGAHLHFEMKYNGVYIDPTTVFNFQEGTYVTATAEIEQSKIQAVEDEYQKELSKHRYYKVRRGDCLGKIARKYGTTVGKLKRLNGLRSDSIRPGQVLKCS
ncbi:MULTISPECIES: peptidoglycan DD-metalloendopeptidase family protein [unclassified Fibrobacter]|uniref:peptidoglycan DD-metalloendopeptidase family protein n=1 Tax=unclassified Fibrobacter TaxID=2634177 RepID=UPI000D6D32BA|nr:MULTISPECIES: peptidoglycan DD-metalloendopeptidase family protein [unclassified Fibrobacter]PWJ67055.1 murein DD-endopeptidase MepM/ murein hydrolase activator NlpD [Fibrobacter sp. UWR4]PZW70622.1 murein DD-endopeptidase MepM/ murein hydrolase activator NlpD [Fibrobacter sp. UWR1]